MQKLILALVVVCFTLSACSGEKKYKYQTPKEAFEKGEAAFNKKRYTDAIDFFKGVFDFGRTNEYADDAQLMLAKAHQASGDYATAQTDYLEFMRLYRSDPRSIDAEFERLRCYNELSPDFDLDQTDTEQAITNMNIFLQRYPNDQRAPTVMLMIKEMRDKLGHKVYVSGQTYERRNYFQAAAMSYEQVLERYGDSQWADDALVAAIRCYIGFAKASVVERQTERYQKAIDTYNRLVELFPKSDLLRTAEGYYTEANDALQAIKKPVAKS
jgi:outer membrane protein assembly factor BamD